MNFAMNSFFRWKIDDDGVLKQKKNEDRIIKIYIEITIVEITIYKHIY